MESVFTVTQLNTRVRGMLKSSPELQDIWVSGEISNLTRAASGHYYFVLKDAGSEIRCALFSRSRSRMDFEPADNLKVQAFGGLDIYVQRGSYQFIVENMRRSGIGDLHLRFEEMKRRLESEGLFSPSHKRPLPRYPRRIGVVTSETGAVIHDIIMTSSTRFPADIVLAPSMVQGEGAARTIVAGIKLLECYGVDVIIVARGGGSLEDLWPFNEESVARAIYACKVPVVSAVGHETDFTIADFVADVRAPTPTGAAAIILRDRKETSDQIDRDMAVAEKALSSVMERMRRRFDVADAKLSLEAASNDLCMRSMDLDSVWSSVEWGLRGVLSRMRERLSEVQSRISPSIALSRLSVLSARLSTMESEIERLSSGKLAESSSRLNELSAQLEALNPSRVLDRGYGIVVDSEGRAVSSVDGLAVGESIGIRMRGGSATAEVKGIRKDRDEGYGRIQERGRRHELRDGHGEA